MNRVFVAAVVNNLTEEEIKAAIPAAKARRFDMLQKRALATALKALEISGISNPDMILNGTSLGSIGTSLKILDAMHAEGESMSMPTAFMQSTHNTIASLIAIYTQNHGYNATYSQGNVSFECAIQDAFLRIKSGIATSALVCKNDEIPQQFVDNPLLFGDIHIENCSEAWVLTSDPECGTALFEIENVILTHKPNVDSAKIIKKSL